MAAREAHRPTVRMNGDFRVLCAIYKTIKLRKSYELERFTFGFISMPHEFSSIILHTIPPSASLKNPFDVRSPFIHSFLIGSIHIQLFNITLFFLPLLNTRAFLSLDIHCHHGVQMKFREEGGVTKSAYNTSAGAKGQRKNSINVPARIPIN